MNGKPCAPSNMAQNWESIDWNKASAYVKKLQMRIVKAQKEGHYSKVKSLQWMLTHSFYAKALAVKRVTSNRGKNTSGVDHELWLTPQAKFDAISKLKRKWIAKKYWHYIGTRQWTFAAELKGDSTKAPYLALEYATNTNILRFKKIVAEANPFDERWNGYYEERDGEKMLNSTKGREKLLKLWRNQKHLCPVCNEPITSETSFKVHKIFENGTYRKSMMVHPLCHNKLHNSAVFSFESGFREEALRKA